MKKALRLFGYALGGLCVLAAGIWVLTLTVGTKDTLYQGKNAYYWSEQITNSVAAASNRAIAVLHGEIIPYLTNQMFCDTNDSRFRMALVEQLNSLPGVQIEYLISYGRRGQAVGQLGFFGTNAKPAIPALLKALRSRDEPLLGAAAGALVRIQAEAKVAVPALIEGAVDSLGRGQPDVVEALGDYGAEAKAAVPVLIKLLKDRSSKDIRTAVPAALKKIDPEAAAAAGVK